MASTTSGQSSSLRPSVSQWLASVPSLDPGAAAAAGALFNKHGIDTDFLDFLASDRGSLILSAWRGAPIHRTAAPVASQEPSDLKQRQQGRQRISAADRQGECQHSGHYFAKPEPRKPVQVQPAATVRPSGGSPPNSPDVKSTTMASAESSSPTLNETRYVGTVKSYCHKTGYGFIELRPDIYCSTSDLQGAQHLEPGLSVEFSLTHDGRGRPQAQKITVLTPAAEPEGAQTGTPRVLGRLKSVGPNYGFIDSPEAMQAHGRDVYFARSQLPAGRWEIGKQVSFSLTLNQRAQPQARDIAWGSQEPESDSEGTEEPEKTNSDFAAAAPPTVRKW